MMEINCGWPPSGKAKTCSPLGVKTFLKSCSIGQLNRYGYETMEPKTYANAVCSFRYLTILTDFLSSSTYEGVSVHHGLSTATFFIAMIKEAIIKVVLTFSLLLFRRLDDRNRLCQIS